MTDGEGPVTVPANPHLDRVVPPIEAYGFAGMTVINRGGRTFAMIGTGPNIDELLESFAATALKDEPK